MSSADVKTLLILVDGLDPEYVRHSEMPNLRRLASAGRYRLGKAVLPSVTNVNNASVVTGTFPAEHGIVSNFYRDPRTGEDVLMERAEDLERPTWCELAAARGRGGALIAAKDKVKTLLARGALVAFSAEQPDPEIVAAIGPPPGIYTAAANHWVLRAARVLLRRPEIDWLYVSTTDYMMHTYEPQHEASCEHLYQLDAILGEIAGDHSRLRLGLTADHGMNAKTRGVDIARLLRAKGVEADAVPIIRDKHVVHHGNLGGACYVYLRDLQTADGARQALASEPGIEEVYARAEAAERFRLRANRIGDLFVLADRETVFGSLRQAREDVVVRSHGSRHELSVPLLLNGPGLGHVEPEYNLDVTRALIAAGGGD